jgi:hypothetical protein
MRRERPIPDRVAEFLRQQAGVAFCDGCLQDRLSVPSLPATNAATTGLGQRPGFDRRVGVCVCGQVRKIIGVKLAAG